MTACERGLLLNGAGVLLSTSLGLWLALAPKQSQALQSRISSWPVMRLLMFGRFIRSPAYITYARALGIGFLTLSTLGLLFFLGVAFQCWIGSSP